MLTQTWYPMKGKIYGESFYDYTEPEYLLFDRVLKLRGDYIDMPLLHKINNSPYIYKFIDNSIYLYDTINKKFMGGFKLNLNRNILSIKQTGNYLDMKFKKIDSVLLVHLKDLPKKVRLNCSRLLAEETLKDLIKNYNTSDFYFDTKTIKFMNEDEDCNYYFVITEKSREFDIYTKFRVTITFTEDNKIELHDLQAF